jgi:hypothetical protein
MKLFEQKLSWLDAEQACKGLDADLLSIHSQQQDETASRLAHGKDAFCVSAFHCFLSVLGRIVVERAVLCSALFGSILQWIGMQDFASMGNFVWSDGEPVIYENWNPGEPQVRS